MEISELLQSSPVFYITLSFALGLVVGSFLNVVIYRLPIMMERDWRRQCAELTKQQVEEPEERFDLVVPRSRCPSCGHAISARHNIPLISYLFLKGRCAHCGEAISIRYPLVELLTGVVSAVVAWRFGFTLEALLAIALSWALIALSGIDLDRQLLPDSISLPLLWLGLLISAFGQSLSGEVLFITPADSIVGAAAGYLALWLVYQLFKLLTGKEGMGYGDFKLLAVFGAWLGWQLLPLIILVSALVGAVVGICMIAFGGRSREQPIPFGPYLAAAGWVAMLWGGDIMAGYLSTLGL